MKKIIVILLIINSVTSCKKEFLEIKPDKKLVVPSTLDDFEALLDYSDRMNRFLPEMGEIQADNYYWDHQGWLNSSNQSYKNGYIWNKNIYEAGIGGADWNASYQIVFQANNALDGLANLDKTNETAKYKYIKGRALFFRAYAFYMVAQLYCAPYNKTNDNSGLGIPLRLTSDINTPSRRATIKETYDQIISDLLNAENLLPKDDNIKTRPSKPAAQAMLSRVYLTMQDYKKALTYANKIIKDQNYKLIDFTTLNESSNYPMQKFNQEVIFHSEMNSGGPLAVAQINIDSTLYQSYNDSDLRKKLWFQLKNGKMRFRGSYNGSAIYFNGLAVDECYLTKSECLARLGEYKEATKVLDTLLSTRYIKYTPILTNSTTEALTIILLERRKELLLRGIRWTDLRRLNLDALTAETLYRNFNSKIYTLKPNSLNYVLPIPPNVIELTNLQQNPRE